MRHAVSTSQPSTNPVKFAEPRPFSDPEAAVRKLIEIANTAEPVQDARIYIERVNGPFLAAGGSPAEYRAGIERAIAKGWLWRHESGTYVKFTDAGAELLGLAFGCIDLIVTPDKGWCRRFEEPIPLPDEMAAMPAIPDAAHLGLISEIPVRLADVEEFL